MTYIIPDGFYLSPEEIETLRQSKRELSQYAQEKLWELAKQEFYPIMTL